MQHDSTASARSAAARLVVLSLAVVLAGCVGRFSLDAREQRQAEARADRLIAASKRVEPILTPELERISQEVGGGLYGLDHRIKERDSIVRKIRSQLQNGTARSVAAASIRDPLRYTIVVDDAPPGYYVEAVKQVLHELERSGQRVEQVRNYWPRGDDYAGINVSLRDPTGPLWELQLHTPGSKQAQIASHDLYRVYRLPETPLETKRELFREMTAIADAAAVPEGALGPDLLHPTEERRMHPAPPAELRGEDPLSRDPLGVEARRHARGQLDARDRPVLDVARREHPAL